MRVWVVLWEREPAAYGIGRGPTGVWGIYASNKAARKALAAQGGVHAGYHHGHIGDMRYTIRIMDVLE